jgi:hypothetical protein
MLMQRSMSKSYRVSSGISLPWVSGSLESAIRKSSNGVDNVAHGLRPRHVMPSVLHELGGAIISGPFKLDRVGEELVVKSGGCKGIVEGHVQVEHIPQGQDGPRWYLGPSGSTYDEVRLPVGGFHYDGRNR